MLPCASRKFVKGMDSITPSRAATFNGPRIDMAQRRREWAVGAESGGVDGTARTSQFRGEQGNLPGGRVVAEVGEEVEEFHARSPWAEVGPSCGVGVEEQGEAGQ